MLVSLVIPALDEEDCIGSVVRGFKQLCGPGGEPVLDKVVVVDNGSQDQTAMRAKEAGAIVVRQPFRGYGRACLAGIDYLGSQGPPDVVAFADGDGAQRAEDLVKLLAPIYRAQADFVVGSRIHRGQDAMTLPQRFGNRLASVLLTHLYGSKTTDLGPFRALRWSALESMQMQDPTYGWTVEMQIKAVLLKIPTVEIEVENRPRVSGKSKVSGTVRGVVGAGSKILGLLLKEAVQPSVRTLD